MKKISFLEKKNHFFKKNKKIYASIQCKIRFLPKRGHFLNESKNDQKKYRHFSGVIAPLTFKKMKKPQKWRFPILRKAKKTGFFEFRNKKVQNRVAKNGHHYFSEVFILRGLFSLVEAKNGKKHAKKGVKKGVKKGSFLAFCENT